MYVTDNGGKTAGMSADWGLAIDPVWQPTTTPALDAAASTPVSWLLLGGKQHIAYRSGNDICFVPTVDPTASGWGSPVVAVNGPNPHEPHLAEVAGAPALAYVEWSGQEDSLRYAYSVDQDGQQWSSPIVVSSTVSSGAVQLVDVNGFPAIFDYNANFRRAVNPARTVWTAPTPTGGGNGPKTLMLDDLPGVVTPGRSYFYRALDEYGAEWSATPLGGTVADQCALALIQGNPAVAFGSYYGGTIRYIRALDADGSSWGPVVQLEDIEIWGLDLQVVDGVPRLALWTSDTYSSRIKYLEANDAVGSSWKPSVHVCAGGDPHVLDLAGEVGLGYVSNGKIEIARLP
jgi:hypothetical protein